MYEINLTKDCFDMGMYTSMCQQYTDEELFMAAFVAKQKIEEAVMDFYSGGLQVSVVMISYSHGKIGYRIDYDTKESGIVSRYIRDDKQFETRVMYGKNNITIFSKGEESEKELIRPFQYMLIFHYADIIEKCKEAFSKICKVDGVVQLLIKNFQQTHKGDEENA